MGARETGEQQREQGESCTCRKQLLKAARRSAHGVQHSKAHTAQTRKQTGIFATPFISRARVSSTSVFARLAAIASEEADPENEPENQLEQLKLSRDYIVLNVNSNLRRRLF
jgi:hypothetical protein